MVETNKGTTPPVKKKNWRLKAGIALFFIAILVYIFWPRSRFSVYDPPLPYVFDESYEKALNSISNHIGHDSILIVYGPRGIGKSRGIRQMIELQRQNGRLIFDFDFSTLSRPATKYDYNEHIRQALFDAVRSIDGRVSHSTAFKTGLYTAENIISTLYKTQGSFDKRNLRDNLLIRLGHVFDVVSRNSSAIDYAVLFRIIGQFSVLRPIVVINSPQDDAILDFLCDTSSSVVVETSNIQWFMENKTMFKCGASPVHVGEFTPERARKLLGPMLKPWMQSSLFDSFGGYGSAFVAVHEKMRNGLEFKVALADTQLEITEHFNKTVEGKKDIVCGVWKSGDAVYKSEYNELIDSGILGLSDLATVSIANTAMKKLAQSLCK